MYNNFLWENLMSFSGVKIMKCGLKVSQFKVVGCYIKENEVSQTNF
jgi:hypothetical protein